MLMILSFVLLALFSILSVLSMRVSTVCARGSYGFDVNASNGKIGIILAGTNFILFLACFIVAFNLIEWYIVLPLLLFSLIAPGFLVTKDNLGFWVQNKMGGDLWVHLFGIGFLVSILY
jgi:hypothetical protein